MKSKRKFLFSIGIILFIVISLFMFFYTQSMHGFFFGWEQEADPPVAIAMHKTSIDFGNGNIHSRDGNALVLYGERGYFFSTEWTKDPKYQNVTLFSVNLSGGDRVIHYTGNFEIQEHSIYFESMQNIITCLSNKNGYTNECGVYYYNGVIYFRDVQKTVAYNLRTKAITESGFDETPYPRTKYWVNVDFEGSDCTIGSRDTGEQRVISLAKMAEKNCYAKKILDLSKAKTANSRSRVGQYSTEFFANVEVVDDRIYIIGTVGNSHGHSFAVIFEYSFEADTYYFIKYKEVGDTVATNVSLISWLERTVE